MNDNPEKRDSEKKEADDLGFEGQSGRHGNLSPEEQQIYENKLKLQIEKHREEKLKLQLEVELMQKQLRNLVSGEDEK